MSLTGRAAMRRMVARLAKTVFAAADLFVPARPGPRLLIYHQVGTTMGREMEVTERAFHRHLDWITANGSAIDLGSAIDRRGEADAASLFTLGFDDGYRDVYDTAFPVLRARRIPFTLYLTTAPVETGEPLTPGGQADPLTWDQVREMLDSGLMAVGAHTHTHPDLRHLEAAAIADELDRSNELIVRRCGVTPLHFAYPKGYWSEAADPLVRSRYRTAVLGGGRPVTAASDLHKLHRVPVQRSDGVVFFVRKARRGLRLEEVVRRRLSGYRGP